MTNPNFAQRVEFNFSLLDEKKITLEALAEVVITKSEAFAKVSEHESVHTIVEFIYKKTASDFGQLFLDVEKGLSHPFEEVLILSGTLLDARRKEIIGKLKSKTNRPKNILLITTQVVEAGVDIDMDLGFKNISLIDSDEQLAGRVNRNASKKNCEVYLFRLNDPAVLYGKDDRYNVRIEREEHEEILREKDFARLYDLVFSRIDQTNTKNASGYADNFKNGFLSEISRLNFPKVDRSFQIIDQDNASVFVPLHLPIKLEYAEVFSEAELSFLHKLDGWSKGESMIDGRKVWDIYVAAITQKSETFDLGEVIKFNTLQRIMAKFTFSLFAQSRVVRDLREFCGHEDDGYGYMYLAHYAQVYSFDEGLIANKFTATENQFL
jgi:CRISPR-associated endonuclease/helicase Cas3